MLPSIPQALREGVGGWMAGAAAGAAIGSVVPGPGTAVGGVVGGILGGIGGGIAANRVAGGVANWVVDDDSVGSIRILNDEIPILASEYLLTDKEVEILIEEVGQIVDAKWLREMFKQSDKGRNDTRARAYVRRELEPKFRAIIRRRRTISLPSEREFERGVDNLVDGLDMPKEHATN